MIETGIDLVDVERIEQRISKDNGFKEMIFSPAEINYCELKKNKFEHYAARFAAKEAFFKALGTGWKNGTFFNEIEVVHDAYGKPFINITGATKNTLDHLNMKISVSLSHLKNMATAIVIIEK